MFRLNFEDPARPPNIVTTNLQLQPDDSLLLYGFFGEALVSAARAHPRWQFQITRAGGLEGTAFFATHACIRNDRNEKVGDVWRTSHYELALTNERVKYSLDRGTSRRTSKLDVALRLIKKYCGAAPAVELIDRAEIDIYAGLRARVNRFFVDHRDTMRKITLIMEDYIVANIDLFYEEVPELKAQIDKQTLLDAHDHLRISNSILAAPAPARLTVVLRDDKYVLQRAGLSVMVKTSDTLPEEVRMKVGMLKLATNGQCIYNVGYRHSDVAMLVVYSGPLE